jgi:hypothetical protein
MAGPNTIFIQKICSLQRVQKFLDSVGRNSRSSKAVYGVAISHFQVFLRIQCFPVSADELPKRNIDDLIHAVIKVGIASLPIAGPILGEFYNHILATPLNKRQAAFFS